MQTTTKYIIAALLALAVQTYLIWNVEAGTKYIEALIGTKDKQNRVTVSAVKSALVFLVIAGAGVWLIRWQENRSGGGASPSLSPDGQF